MDTTTYAIDLAKSVFQLYWIEPATGQIHHKKLTRAKLSTFLANRPPARIAMEACGSAHHWGRVLRELGHDIELLPPHKVREHVGGNKNDLADARGIWLAARQGDIRRVGLKSAEQQAALMVHRARSRLVSERTAQCNALRAQLYEFGLAIPQGRKVLVRWIAEHRAQIEAALPAVVVRLLDGQLQALRLLDERIDVLEQEIALFHKASPSAGQLQQVPGIGPLGASALAATIGDGSAWKSAREFAGCLGLVPRHSGTGGKVRIGAISKRGDAYLRTLLIHGARNLVRCAQPSAWIAQMLQRRPFNVVVTAVAHKLARIAWAMIAHGSAYRAPPALAPAGGLPQP
jgi:transposase